jgi:hypothetical protein
MISNNQHDKPPGREWREQAACRGVDPELFFPAAESGPTRTAQVAAAKAVCAGCPVRQECLAEALARIPYGICGGLTEHERRMLHRRSDLTTHGRVAAVPAAVEAMANDGLRPGLTARTTARERAQVGRALLAAGRTSGQVARACGVSARTAQRWAAPITTLIARMTGTTDATGPASTTDVRGASTSSPGVGEGSAAATGLPSGSPQHTTARQAHEHRKGSEGR